MLQLHFKRGSPRNIQVHRMHILLELKCKKIPRSSSVNWREILITFFIFPSIPSPIMSRTFVKLSISSTNWMNDTLKILYLVTAGK